MCGRVGLHTILSVYHVDVDAKIMENIKRSFYFPDQKPHHTTDIQSLPRSPQSRPLFFVRRHLTYKGIITLKTQMNAFFQPQLKVWPLLVYFHSNESRIFDMLLRNELTFKSGLNIQMESFISALVSVEVKIKKILTGRAMYKDIETFLDSQPNLQVITKEIQILKKFNPFNDGSSQILDTHSSKISDCEVLNTPLSEIPNDTDVQFENVLILPRILKHIESLCQFCENFQLEHCKNDNSVIRLRVLAEENKESWKEKSMADVTAIVNECLHYFFIEPSSANRAKQLEFLEIFEVLYTETKELRTFLNQNNFLGKQGQERFQQLLAIVQQGLQHEEYNAAVLSKLYAVYVLLAPLNNTELSFKELLDAVKGLDISTRSAQFRTVNSNIDLIRMWFSKPEVCLAIAYIM